MKVFSLIILCHATEVFGFKSNEFVEHGREVYETGTECNHRKYQTNY